MSVRFSNKHGFTLIEIIAVLTILGIFSVLVLSLNMSAGLNSEVETAKIHLLYARYMALSNDTVSWGISFSASSYELQKAGSTTTFPLPGENSSTHTLPPGISITPVTITFDGKGSVSSPVTPVTEVMFSDGNKITIIKNTGFIP